MQLLLYRAGLLFPCSDILFNMYVSIFFCVCVYVCLCVCVCERERESV